MFSLSELVDIYGVPTLVKLSNDNPGADENDPSNINTTLISNLLAEMEGQYGSLVLQYPHLKNKVYRLIILLLHKRRQQQGHLLMEPALQKEYEDILAELQKYKIILFEVHYGKGK
ncbi:MAG: hypothetical protein QXX84_06920 [Sulfolobales archaeon]